MSVLSLCMLQNYFGYWFVLLTPHGAAVLVCPFTKKEQGERWGRGADYEI